MKRIFRFIKFYRLPILSGILIGTSYIPFPPWALAFCFVPLWIFIQNKELTFKEVFIGGWLTQFILSLIGFHWVMYVAHDFGFLPWPVAIVVLLLFAACVHLYIPLAALLFFWLNKKLQWPLIFKFISLALITAFFEKYWPAIFPWNLGYPLFWANIPIYHLADIIGFQGLSSGVMLINAWIAWISTHSNRKIWIRHSIALLIFLSLCGLWGLKRKQDWIQTDAEVKILQIQANIGNLERYYAERGAGFQKVITQKYIDLTKNALLTHKDAELIIWPESAYPDYLFTQFGDPNNESLFINHVQQSQTPHLIGAFTQEYIKTKNNFGRKIFNSLHVIDSNGKQIGPTYKKSILLAFGEYIPFSEQFPILEKLLPMVSSFGRGVGPSTIDVNLRDNNVRIGLQICYEGLYDYFSRALAQQKADLIVNLTNDSWFGKQFEPTQHLYMTLGRAIETRRPLIRNTNTGISTAVLADGTVLQKSPIYEEWFDQFRIKYKKNAPETFYTRHGNLWILIMIALFAICILTGLKKQK